MANNTPTAKALTYSISVWITRPVRVFDVEDTLSASAAWMQSREAKRELEREVLQALRKLDGDCDVEVIEVTEKVE